MKAYIISGPDTMKCDIKQIQVDPAEIKLIMSSSPELLIKKENYNEAAFDALSNTLKNLVVSANGVHTINIPRGTVEVDSTRSGIRTFHNTLSNVNKEEDIKNPVQPLIDGKFTQAPQGAVDKLDQSVLDSFTL